MEEIRPIAREGTSTAADVEWAFPAKAIGAFLDVASREVIFEPGLRLPVFPGASLMRLALPPVAWAAPSDNGWLCWLFAFA